MQKLLNALDLNDFVENFCTHFARAKSFAFSADRAVLIKLIKELENLNLKPLPQIGNLDSEILKLQKFGVLHLEKIIDFVKIFNYFLYLKNFVKPESENLYIVLQSIQMPLAIQKICDIFDENFDFKLGTYPEIDGIKNSISHTKSQINKEFSKILSNEKVATFLVDSQVHLINSEECLLLKAGYSKALKGRILNRSANGFFYVLPENIASLKTKQSDLQDALENLIFEVCKSISSSLQKHILFLKFINKEFDKIDHIFARVSFAKAHNFEFIFNTHKDILLRDFCHPNLKNPKPLNIEISKKITLITGVNAGGKTMLLKSILSASLCAKYLLPLKLNAHHSKIPIFKNLFAIISDPQNSKNDISTFAGRMLEFSQILGADNFILGIDEIELGTDSDEAAALYQVMLDFVAHKNCKIIITTHHKRLAALMAKRDDVQLVAALFDEKKMRPEFNFLSGSIGKSYAFESAQRYGIPNSLVAKAREVYGADLQNLNELIEKSSALERELRNKISSAEAKLQNLDKKEQDFQNLKEQKIAELENYRRKFEREYMQILSVLKNVVKENDNAKIHRAMNEASKKMQNLQNLNDADSEKSARNEMKNSESKQKFKIGDWAKFGNTRGKIISINGKFCVLEAQNARLKIELKKLQPCAKPPKQEQKIKLESTKIQKASVSLDLHGMRVDEAIVELEIFISNALIAGFDEVLVYHGIGTGRLSAAVADFLKTHKSVIAFSDAPPNMGGFGAKIIKL